MTQVATTFVTREEFVAAIGELKARVIGLENLANRLGYTVDVPETESVPESQSDADAPTVLSSVPSDYDDSDRDVHGRPSGVDYRAVAYGLTTLRGDVTDALGSSPEVTRRYADAVDWFVSCFRGDASFNEAEFRAACA